MADQKPAAPEERSPDAPLLTVDLSARLGQIKREEDWKRKDRLAIPLVKTPGLRMVLVALHAGTAISSHKADGPIAIQVMEGHIKFTAQSQTVDLQRDQMLALQTGLPHSVEAVEESAFLLTVAT